MNIWFTATVSEAHPNSRDARDADKVGHVWDSASSGVWCFGYRSEGCGCGVVGDTWWGREGCLWICRWWIDPWEVWQLVLQGKMLVCESEMISITLEVLPSLTLDFRWQRDDGMMCWQTNLDRLKNKHEKADAEEKWRKQKLSWRDDHQKVYS